MKKLLLLLMLIPFFGMSQTKNVISVSRVFPKADKVLEFEKALAAHAKKYHHGDWNWRVYEISSGPDANGYHIAEGPSSWDGYDNRGNLGTEHNNDWNRSVAIYLTDRSENSYSEYDDSLSTVPLGNYSKNIVVSHMYPKPGMINYATDLIKRQRKVWVAGGENVAVYFAVVSGAPQIVTVSRLKDGLKELATGYRKPMSERYNMVNGAGSWDVYLSDYSKAVESRWSELLVYRADLSSQ